jgi:metallophosphoesterase (TIGR03767 family)
VLTSERRLGAGSQLRAGSAAAYRRVEELEGERHSVRTDLAGGADIPEVQNNGHFIACFAHITDLHVADVQSPARFEFINREYEDVRFRELLPMQRPQESLNALAVEAMVQALNRLESSPVTQSPIEMAVISGDGIDNVQRNELANFLALLDGGPVRPDSGASGYEGVQSTAWPGETYWKPDGPPEGDLFQGAFAFPGMPGLLEQAMEPFEAEALRVPWLGCYGNHEEVCQGVGIVTPALARLMTGIRKPLLLPEGFDRETALATFVNSPEVFMSGPSIEVAPDSGRRPITREEFASAHFESGSHGFGPTDGPDPCLYYAHDTPTVRFITLDTVCAAGGADGCIDAPQLHWLERRLEEVHSRFRSRDGSPVRTRNEDRLVVIVSHHGFDSLRNPRAEVLADRLLDLLLRFDNVVLWLNGHIHANRITPRAGRNGARGFWEVTTSSIVDWPCQGRIVELFDAGRGRLGIACTMVDHDGAGLAALHRELAANVPFNGFDSGRPGTLLDRNALLLLPARL